MTAERWARVKEIYHNACELAAAERVAFLADSCGADAELRREVESLLAEDGSRAAILDGAANASLAVAETSAGTQLGPYRIEASIGKGGMGEVWRARDTRLNRDVAIKISAQQFTHRFEREARAIAALNHPNICTLHDIGPNYLVMELVEGPTLADRIKKGPIPIEEAIAIAKQIADALEAAHGRGIVHRDLKPANIKIRPDGSVKVLDFGLAKSGGEGGAADEMLTATTPGMIMGTAGYMAPEQARGEKVDKRADIWAFGVVLFEMTTGRRLFEGKTTSDTMAAVIREEPDWTRAPAKVRRLLRACLEKDPRRRLRDIGDTERLLDTESTAAAPSRSRFGKAGWIAAGVLALVAAALTFVRPAPPDLSAYKFTPITRDAAGNGHPVWSPDGKSIAYDANVHGVFQVFTKALGATDAAQLTHGADDCGYPFWSPDGATIYYYYFRGGLWAVPASGGMPELVMDKVGTHALHPDGKTLVFGRGGKAWVGPLKGGTPRELSSAPRGGVGVMRFSPDGSKLFVQSRDELWILPWPSGAPRNLGAVGYGGSWLPDSRHLLVSEDIHGGDDRISLVDTADGSRRVIYRAAHPLLSPSVSPDGKKIVYAAGAYAWNILEISIPEGRVHTMLGGSGVSMWPDWDPSGTHYLYSTMSVGTGGAIEDRSAAEGGFSRHMVEPPQGSHNFNAKGARWSPDGTRLLFVQTSVTPYQLTIANASGGRWTPLADVPFTDTDAWSPDGQWIAFLRIQGGKVQLVKMKPTAGATAIALTTFVPAPGIYQVLQWSPSDNWIAYPTADGTSMVSPDGNTVRKLTARNLLAFAFSKDGSQVYGIDQNTTGAGAQWQLYSIDVKTGADKLLAPIDLPASTEGIAGFSLHPDGKRFLTSIAKWPYDIWMLEGWDQPPQKTWLDRLLRR